MRADELKFCRDNASSGSVPPAGAVLQLLPSSDVEKVGARLQSPDDSGKISLEKFKATTSRVTAAVWAPPAGAHAPLYSKKAVPSITSQEQLEHDKENVHPEVEEYKLKLAACEEELVAARHEARTSNEAYACLWRELASWDAEMQQVRSIKQHWCSAVNPGALVNTA
jgi:hypothetical protein